MHPCQVFSFASHQSAGGHSKYAAGQVVPRFPGPVRAWRWWQEDLLLLSSPALLQPAGPGQGPPSQEPRGGGWYEGPGPPLAPLGLPWQAEAAAWGQEEGLEAPAGGAGAGTQVWQD